ncbi:MAG: pectinesterase family protein, partial [Phycisphaerae bacterium]|nr:pectinesterase family protein [Phycisphaerae bacterium]
MHKYLIICYVFSIIFGFGISSDVQAVDMTITGVFPTNNAAEVCADTKLWLTFGTVPIVSTSGTLQICKVSDDSVVYQLDLQTLPVNVYGPLASGWPYQINLNGLVLNYEPFAVSGNTLEIYPSTRLDYNTEYYVKMTAGFCTDSGSNTSPAITDNTTWRFTAKTAAPAADHDYMVALDGSGDFCTVQGAVDAVANNDSVRTLIRIKNGNYRGMVHIPSAKINITWLGENKDTTVISAYNREAFNAGSDKRMLVRCYAGGFRMYNLTLYNTAPDNSGQAETIKNSGSKCIMRNCNFKSYQDTLLLGGKMYFKDCYIEGDTDYIWGDGTVYFDKCQMHSMSSSSYVTQPRTPNGTNGYFLVDCNLTAQTGITDCWLGRMFLDRSEYAQVVLINCVMPTAPFNPIGWKKNTLVDTSNLRLWEYKSVDPSGNLIDVSGRLYPGSRQLTDVEAVFWRDVNNVFSGTWNPKADAEAPSASWQPSPANGATDVAAETPISWSAGAGAESHLIYFGTTNPPPFIEEVTETSYVVQQFLYASTVYYWRVDEKNAAGTTTGTVWSFTTGTTSDTTPPTPNPMIWESEPNAVNRNTITMTASLATDDNFGVQYYFSNITDPNHDSGWQDSTTYINTGLNNNTTYIYKVKARDNSLNHNTTADSNTAEAATFRYDCNAVLNSDLSEDCQVNFADFVIFADEWLLPRLATDFIINSTFDSELVPWQLVDAFGAIGTMTATFDDSNGLPPGSAYLQANA